MNRNPNENNVKLSIRIDVSSASRTESDSMEILEDELLSCFE